MYGMDVDITALAKPYLETFEMRSDTVDTCSPIGTKTSSFCVSRHCDINMRFECYEDKETKTLFQIEGVLNEEQS